MGNITRNCPHCNTKSVSFTSFSEVANPNKFRRSTTVFFCGNCYGGYIVEFFYSSSGISAHGLKGDIGQKADLIPVCEYPIAKETIPPKHLPENIDKFFLQAAKSLIENHLDASAMMSRKVLEVAVKKLDPSGSGTLYDRIEGLFNSGKITEELKDWAHIIRGNGNEAAHEETPVTKEFAEDLLAFCEIFLMYTFTMPGMVEEKRNKRTNKQLT